MKQKINWNLVLVSLFSTVLTLISIILVCYSLFQGQVKKDLKTTAKVLAANGISRLAAGEGAFIDPELRITLISADGSVLYDNDVVTNEMENHLNRPEIQEAFQTGVGESVRKSDTMNMKTFYQAILLEDGTVLRVSTEARSMLSVFMEVIPYMIFVLCVILILCVVLSHYLTSQLVQPISEMADNMENLHSESVYKELLPFVHRIREQHEDILSFAKSRQDFTANVSHELKTPLTAISGYAELIENEMIDHDTQVKFAGDIRKNADRLVNLINDIIRLSELDSSEARTEFRPEDLYEVAAERVELLQDMADRKNVTLSLYGVTTPVLSNRGMLVELLDNLIQNAIRYNVNGGKVDVRVSQLDNQSCLVVEDTGIGIPKEDMNRVFERFYRVDKSRSRETGGTGLGLAIVKHIIELHDGKITLESQVGKGTKITILI